MSFLSAIPPPLAVVCFLLGGGLGWFFFFVTVSIFEGSIRPRFFPNNSPYSGPRGYQHRSRQPEHQVVQPPRGVRRERNGRSESEGQTEIDLQAIIL
jgi:hypothetical protein